MTRQEIFEAIDAERKRQDELHPKWHGDDHGMVVLAEEFGEVAKALYEMKHSDGYDFMLRDAELKSELIQVAAVCVRWLENVD